MKTFFHTIFESKAKTTILVYSTLSLLAVLYFKLFHFLGYNHFDAPSFIGGSRLIFGLPDALDFQSRLSKPLILLFPGFLEWLWGIHPQYGYLIQDVVFFYLCGYFLFKLLLIVFESSKTAFLGMVVYATCQPFACFSFLILSDVGGWFFGIFSFYLSIKHIKNGSLTPSKLFVIGFISGIGCLIKESAIVGLLFLYSYLLYEKASIKSKIFRIAYSGIGFLFPFVSSFILINHFYGDSVIKRLHDGYKDTEHDKFQFSQLKQIYRIIDVYWFLFLFGLSNAIKKIKLKDNDVFLKAVLFSIFIFGGLMQIWPYLLDRILFMLAPFMVIIIVLGLRQFSNFEYFLVITAGIINIGMTYFIYKYKANGLIYICSAFYLLIFTYVYWKLKREKKSPLSVG